jgi:hypothetical protein
MDDRTVFWIAVLTIGATHTLAVTVERLESPHPNLHEISNSLPIPSHQVGLNSGDEGYGRGRKSTLWKLKRDMLIQGTQMAEGHMTVPGSRPCPCQKSSLCEMIRRKPAQEVCGDMGMWGIVLLFDV